MILKKLIQEIEDHTGKEFDFSKRRDFHRLNGKIERLYKEERRKISMINKIMKSSDGENQIFNDSEHYLQKRFK